MKKLLFLLENSIFYAPSNSQKITEKNRTTELEGPGSIPGLMS